MNTKKCVVVDLDNTLWGGVVGEDGFENLALSLKSPGNSFIAFQQALLDLYDRGVLLAVNSRNNPEDALKVIREHPNMILKEKHFAALRMNWNDKSENMRDLAHELNIGLDSMVFLDDDPTNRGLVRAILPEVEVPELPTDPSEYARFLNALPYFPAEAITDEDKMRGNLYVTERLRKEEERQHSTKEDFLKSLALVMDFYEDDDSAAPRLSQMTEKTNQFNVDKTPFSEEQIRSFVQGAGRRVFHARLSDKFGDYGIVLLAVAELRGKTWHIPSLLMSCRAFGRGVEHAFLSTIAKRAREAGAEQLTIAFTPSSKNIPAREFIDAVFKKEQAVRISNISDSPAWIQIRV
jgi:FkbH-like protein